jgi:hypothetical protein
MNPLKRSMKPTERRSLLVPLACSSAMKLEGIGGLGAEVAFGVLSPACIDRVDTSRHDDTIRTTQKIAKNLENSLPAHLRSSMVRVGSGWVFKPDMEN